MYGWCVKCRTKFQDKFAALRGWAASSPIITRLFIVTFFRNNCTYCGGDLEDNYPPAALCLAVALFPLGIVGCLLLKERQCVLCNRTSSAWIFNKLYSFLCPAEQRYYCSVIQKFYDYLLRGLPLCRLRFHFGLAMITFLFICKFMSI